jgi:type IV pilus assembly protein PilM
MASDAPPAATPAPVEENPLYAAVAPALDELVSELRRSVDYYKNKGGDVDMMMITGGSAQLKNLDKFLTSAVGMTVERMDPFRNVNMSLKSGDPARLEETKSSFAMAIGNGMHIGF